MKRYKMKKNNEPKVDVEILNDIISLRASVIDLMMIDEFEGNNEEQRKLF